MENNICENRHRRRSHHPRNPNEIASERVDFSINTATLYNMYYGTVTITPNTTPTAQHRPQLIIKLDLEASDLRVSDPKRARGTYAHNGSFCAREIG